MLKALTNQPRTYEIWASNTLYLAFAMSLVTHFFLQSGYFAAQHSPAEYLMLYAANPFMLYVYYLIRLGHHGAKTLFLALYGIVILQLCAALILNTITDGLAGSHHELAVKLTGVAVEQTLKIGASILLLLTLRRTEVA